MFFLTRTKRQKRNSISRMKVISLAPGPISDVISLCWPDLTSSVIMRGLTCVILM